VRRRKEEKQKEEKLFLMNVLTTNKRIIKNLSVICC